MFGFQQQFLSAPRRLNPSLLSVLLMVIFVVVLWLKLLNKTFVSCSSSFYSSQAFSEFVFHLAHAVFVLLFWRRRRPFLCSSLRQCCNSQSNGPLGRKFVRTWGEILSMRRFEVESLLEYASACSGFEFFTLDDQKLVDQKLFNKVFKYSLISYGIKFRTIAKVIDLVRGRI